MTVEDPQPELDGDLLLKAYVNGIFPMADPEVGVVEWFKMTSMSPPPWLGGCAPVDSRSRSISASSA